MDLFQEFFVTAMAALIFSCIIVKMVSAAVSNDENIDKEKIVVEEAKISKGLVVKSRKSKKRVKFVEQEVVKNVDRLEIQEPNKDGVELIMSKVGGVVDQFSDKGRAENGEKEKVVSEEVLVDKKVENFLKKGDEFKEENLLEKLIEECGGEREVNDGHDEGKLIDVKKKDLVNDLPVVDEKILSQSLMDGEVNNNNVASVIPQVGSGDGGVYADVTPTLEGGVKLDENEVVELGGELSKGDEEKDKMVRDEYSDDDWEGIERSELEEEFAKAVNFVNEGKGKDSGLENLGSELMMQLYGLQKIAMEGPCHEPQPMALKVSARAKWNVWQRMGSMNPEVAMEQYIKLLSEHVPGWTQQTKDDREVGLETKVLCDPDHIPDSVNSTCKDDRIQETNHVAETGDCAVGEKEKE